MEQLLLKRNYLSKKGWFALVSLLLERPDVIAVISPSHRGPWSETSLLFSDKKLSNTYDYTLCPSLFVIRVKSTAGKTYQFCMYDVTDICESDDQDSADMSITLHNLIQFEISRETAEIMKKISEKIFSELKLLKGYGADYDRMLYEKVGKEIADYEDIKVEKNKLVKESKFKEASLLRTQEKDLLEKINAGEKEVREALKDKYYPDDDTEDEV